MRHFTLLICLLIVCSGCRVNPRAEREIALLRAEILDLEDQYYALKSKCEAQGVDVDNGEIIYESYSGDSYCDDCDIVEPTIYDDAIAPTYPDEPVGSGTEGQELEFIEPEEGSSSRSSILRGNRNGSPSAVSFRDDSGRPEAGESASVKSIRINNQWSRGENLDGIPGDEGLALLVQPIDGLGNVVSSAGFMTVRVVESNSTSLSRQIGMWQFSPKEMQAFIVNEEFIEQGILLHLPWNNMVPTSSRINVFVRFTTGNQRNLDASTQISIEPPPSNYSPDDPLVAEWIENDERWIRVGDSKAIRRPNARRENRQSILPKKERVSAPGWRPVR